MSNLNLKLLHAIASATAAGQMVYVTQADALPFMQHTPALIAVDSNAVDPSDDKKRGAKVTDAGVDYLKNEASKPAATTKFQFQTGGGLELPKVQRKGGFGAGAPSKYPFDEMPVTGYFFVGNNEVESGDAVKTLSSAVGSANQRYAEDVIENGQVKMKTVERAKRGKDRKAIKDANGKNEMETVTIPVKNFTRKYVVRPVEAGKTYGAVQAPVTGAVVVREK